jgi:hypothetical protein
MQVIKRKIRRCGETGLVKTRLDPGASQGDGVPRRRLGGCVLVQRRRAVQTSWSALMTGRFFICSGTLSCPWRPPADAVGDHHWAVVVAARRRHKRAPLTYKGQTARQANIPHFDHRRTMEAEIARRAADFTKRSAIAGDQHISIGSHFSELKHYQRREPGNARSIVTPASQISRRHCGPRPVLQKLLLVSAAFPFGGPE